MGFIYKQIQIETDLAMAFTKKQPKRIVLLVEGNQDFYSILISGISPSIIKSASVEAIICSTVTPGARSNS